VRTLRSHVLTRRWPRKARKSAADLKALAADIQDTERASNSFVPTELPENQQPFSADQYAESAPSCWAPPPQTFTSWFCRAKKTQCTYKLGVSCSSIGAHGVGQALPAAEAQQPRQQTSQDVQQLMCEMLRIEDVGQLIPLHCHVTRRSVNARTTTRRC
jgi:hypothetical protein